MWKRKIKHVHVLAGMVNMSILSYLQEFHYGLEIQELQSYPRGKCED
jgi:hypothetical protein